MRNLLVLYSQMAPEDEIFCACHDYLNSSFLTDYGFAASKAFEEMIGDFDQKKITNPTEAVSYLVQAWKTLVEAEMKKDKQIWDFIDQSHAARYSAVNLTNVGIAQKSNGRLTEQKKDEIHATAAKKPTSGARATAVERAKGAQRKTASVKSSTVKTDSVSGRIELRRFNAQKSTEELFTQLEKIEDLLVACSCLDDVKIVRTKWADLFRESEEQRAAFR